LKRHEMNDVALVTRDILTKIIMEEIIDGRGIEGNVILDFTTIPEEEAQKLRSILDKFGINKSYISQYDRYRLFIAVPVSPELLKLASETVEKP